MVVKVVAQLRHIKPQLERTSASSVTIYSTVLHLTVGPEHETQIFARHREIAWIHHGQLVKALSSPSATTLDNAPTLSNEPPNATCPTGLLTTLTARPTKCLHRVLRRCRRRRVSAPLLLLLDSGVPRPQHDVVVA